jgi:hypothetical protein
MEPPLRDAGDAAEYVGKPGQRIDIVELRRHDQRGHGSGTVGTAFGAGEQPGFASQGKAARSARSAALLVRQIRPSSMNRANRSQRLSM